jgi:S-adenosylmethionine:tRNA ribosyltransferase-isomerase
MNTIDAGFESRLGGMITLDTGLGFQLPDKLVPHEPPEARGLARDQVRLMVSRLRDDRIAHTRFSHLPDFLAPGDVLVINTSATINAAFEAVREARDHSMSAVVLHLSTPLSENGRQWVVELRRRSPTGTSPLLDAQAGEQIRLPVGGIAQLVEPYLVGGNEFSNDRVRLWIAELTLPESTLAYASHYGSPIRYTYAPRQWPLEYYQNVFASQPGSAEMPSAGRPFTHDMLDRLTRKGVRIVPLVLHTGVSSLDADEPPYPERYRVPPETALGVNTARSQGRRVVAVGTTVVRALETVADDDGHLHSDHGWTDLVITPERGMHAVDAILTGLHGPKASHLSMLEALAGRDHLALAYDTALQHRYLWHEFGDLHLMLP